jgi:hypothetical protein
MESQVQHLFKLKIQAGNMSDAAKHQNSINALRQTMAAKFSGASTLLSDAFRSATDARASEISCAPPSAAKRSDSASASALAARMAACVAASTPPSPWASSKSPSSGSASGAGAGEGREEEEAWPSPAPPPPGESCGELDLAPRVFGMSAKVRSAGMWLSQGIKPAYPRRVGPEMQALAPRGGGSGSRPSLRRRKEISPEQTAC